MNTFLTPYLTQQPYFGTPFGFQYPGVTQFANPWLSQWQNPWQNHMLQNQYLQNQLQAFGGFVPGAIPTSTPFAGGFPQFVNGQFPTAQNFGNPFVAINPFATFATPWNTTPTTIPTNTGPVATFLPGLSSNGLPVGTQPFIHNPFANPFANPIAFGIPQGFQTFPQPTLATIPQVNTPFATPINTNLGVATNVNGLTPNLQNGLPNTLPGTLPNTFPTQGFQPGTIPAGYGIFGTSYFTHTPFVNQVNPFLGQFPTQIPGTFVNPQAVNPLVNPLLNPALQQAGQFNPWLNAVPASPTTYSAPVAIETETTQKRAVARNVG